jgi:hypothetical protein
MDSGSAKERMSSRRCSKKARLHGGDLDLHFASGPLMPRQIPSIDQLTIAIRLR